jgi:hypothetical protein
MKEIDVTLEDMEAYRYIFVCIYAYLYIYIFIYSHTYTNELFSLNLTRSRL